MYQRIQRVGVYALIISEGKVLLVEKSKGPFQGKWDLPGGVIEFGEFPETALLREVIEETGLEVEKYTFLKSDSVIINYEDPDLGKTSLHLVGFIYKVTTKPGGIVSPMIDDIEVVHAKWCDLIDSDTDEFSPFVQELIFEYPDQIK